MQTSLDPTLLISLGLLGAFAAVVLVGYVAVTGAAERRSVSRSLRAVSRSSLEPTAVRQQELAMPFSRRFLLPGLARVGNRVNRFSPPAIVDRLDRELVYAGSPAGWDGTRFLALKWVAAVVLVGLTFLLLPTTAVGALQVLVLLPVAGLLGYYLPEWILRARSGRRQHAIRLALPDALDLLAITVEAGLGFDGALDRVGKEMGGPLGEELHRVVQEMRLGKGRSDALRDLSERTTVEELKSFIIAMVQAEIFGISVARVLNVQAAELRTKRRQRAEETAAKLPIKVIFPLLFCIFPAIFVVLLAPAAITIYEELIR
jgi:tight adherence protein C